MLRLIGTKVVLTPGAPVLLPTNSDGVKVNAVFSKKVPERITGIAMGF